MKHILLIFVLVCYSSFGDDYYVATTGSDSTGDGSLGNPYATVSNAVYQSLAITGFVPQKNIYICSGSYYNTTAYVNGYVGGGGGGNMLITAYTNGVTLYGGQLLSGWIDNGDGTYTASLGTFPGTDSNVSSTTNWQPRTLLADGVQVRWAEYPDATLSGTNKLYLQNADPSLNFTTITYTNTMEDTTNNEVCVDNSWNDAQLAVTSIDTGTKVMTLSGAVYRGGGNQLANDVRTYTLRNGKEGMLNPNTFWWDKTNNSIVFRPPIGKIPSSMTIIVPTTTSIIRVNGGLSWGGSVENNVVISNLTFACTTAVLGDGAKKDPGQGYDGAIRFQYTTNCSVANCTVYGCANFGIEGGNAVSAYNYNMEVRDCIVHDCGSGGISLRGEGFGNVISNNFVYNMVGLVKCAAGICSPAGSITGTNYVVSNTISNCDGPGIYLGSGVHLVASKNRIIKCVKQLRDMGGIYVQNPPGGYQNNQHTIIQNWVENVNPTNSLNGGVWDPYVIGIYLDNYTSNSIVASNITWKCAWGMMNYRCTGNNSYINNFFVSPSDDLSISLPNSSGSDCGIGLRANMTNNIFWTSGTPSTPGMDANFGANSWPGNVWYSVASLTNYCPTNATIANPIFVKVPSTSPQYIEDADFSFQVGSPCPGLGIQPLSLEGIGYNGGLQHRPPDIKVTTLRVGNMRMAQ